MYGVKRSQINLYTENRDRLYNYSNSMHRACYVYTRVGQSGAARMIVNALRKWGLPRTCVPVLLMRNYRMCSVRRTYTVVMR